LSLPKKYDVGLVLGDLVYRGSACAGHELRWDADVGQWLLVPKVVFLKNGRFFRSWAVLSGVSSGVIILGLVTWLTFKFAFSPSQARVQVVSVPSSPARLDPLTQIKDASTAQVRKPQGDVVWVSVGEVLPSGAILLRINERTQTAQTDHGLLTMDP
jgi:hypothetical protein